MVATIARTLFAGIVSLITAVCAFGRAASQFPMRQLRSCRAGFRSRCETRNQVSSRSDEPCQRFAHIAAALRPPPHSRHLRFASWRRQLCGADAFLNPAAVLADPTFNSIFVHDLSPAGVGAPRLVGRSVDRLNVPQHGQAGFLAVDKFPDFRLYAASAC